MRRQNTGLTSIFFLQLAIAIFFLILGVQGIITNVSQNSGFAREVAKFMNAENPAVQKTELIMGIISLVAGLLLLLGLFRFGDSRLVVVSSVLIFLFWLTRLVMVRFMTELVVRNGNITFYPDFSTWLLAVSTDVIILCSIWTIARRSS
ncbi:MULTISPECIES: hypothetical protein [unclassified Oceanispirochaeta]|uniref:hypothetical protein n=1 Tax=unclassified Oceanispirochaeta TaxID=2635722 RepID=UPI000E09946A|nr:MULTISPECIES: hypothetical protein [unclassified Oceanispirochaeta]MBF9018498.1 hypothetical protein [Oceanispirochaeta sp. M2]NPD74905.1 hypothetical protein [Oceanispirochaeta sp. M1]RDG29237.1 hypothetical protein DV872_22665 [Oceanispirochaeta sp. M1]